MKKIFHRSLAAASIALIAGTASAGITNTPHNLTATGPGPNKQSTTQQICVFCHTPHAANTAVNAPLWNKGLPPTTYTTYSTANSNTIDGAVLTVGSVSAACLSCHDGTQAMDNLVNAPGSGGLVVGGSNRNYTWTTGANKITGVANLQPDLTNDHPIGIQYCGGGLTGTGTTVNGTCNDKDFKLPVTKTINGVQVFWVDTSVANNTREKTDMILYTRTFTGAQTGPSVECASCHDPHSDKAATGSDVNFMRVTTSGSKICLSCHVK
ncbi:cytochrome c3 family protein [Azoarcus sp. DN11]|uniref:cytochrome c3 family protein n=1 Tax=Azoarcus sp. DN11 TaxID=356837 RepID=UPI000EB01A89|nr:cytochrome c3 family protein [Azoarcus sp. DN11]AYH42061.1 hypothetical protein CDA09_01455 [Azoarcus sp. DN11]